LTIELVDRIEAAVLVIMMVGTVCAIALLRAMKRK